PTCCVPPAPPPKRHRRSGAQADPQARKNQARVFEQQEQNESKDSAADTIAFANFVDCRDTQAQRQPARRARPDQCQFARRRRLNGNGKQQAKVEALEQELGLHPGHRSPIRMPSRPSRSQAPLGNALREAPLPVALPSEAELRESAFPSGAWERDLRPEWYSTFALYDPRPCATASLLRA